MIKKYTPYIVALVLFFAVTLIYFAPQFQGQQLSQHDVIQYQGMSRDIDIHSELYDEDPQWEGRMFGGMPSYFIKLGYTGVIPTHIAQTARKVIGEPASLIFLAFICFYLMLLLYGVDPYSAIPASLAYGLSSYFFIIIGAGHITKMAALAFAPLAMGGVYYALRKNMWLGSAITALSGAMLISVNHPQIAYYFVLIVAAMWISELVRAVKKSILPKFAASTALLMVAGLLALAANSQLLWYSYDSAKETIRAGSELSTPDNGSADNKLDLDYATAWSYGKYETFNLFIPNATGGTSEGGFDANGEVADVLTKYNARSMATELPGYFGPQPMTSGPVYVGAVAIFIFVLGMFLLCNGWRWWILAISLLSIMLAWGSNMMWFTELFYNYFPLYGKFRTVSMILVIVEWTVPFAAALTIHKIVNSQLDREKIKKALKRTVVICGGVALLFVLLGSSLVDFRAAVDAQVPEDVAAAMRSERASMLSSDSIRTLVLVLASAALIFGFVVGKINKRLLIGGVSLLILIDMVPVNLRYLGHDKFMDSHEVAINPTTADAQILADSSIPVFRVFNTTVSPFNDATTSYFHRSVGGYHGAKLSRYQDLIDYHLSSMNMEVYNMLNTKYFIVADQSGAPQAQINDQANGAAWFVDHVEIVDGVEQEIEILDYIDTKVEAAVERSFESFVSPTTPDSTATIEIVDYRVNHLTYSYSSSTPQTAIFSEIYYPKGWTAYVDGVEAPYFRANYILRGMSLPEGEHTIEFKFAAPNFNMLGTISLIASLVIIFGLIISFIINIRNGKEIK